MEEEFEKNVRQMIGNSLMELCLRCVVLNKLDIATLLSGISIIILNGKEKEAKEMMHEFVMNLIPEDRLQEILEQIADSDVDQDTINEFLSKFDHTKAGNA